ncbi:hypothetical protein OGAPHI_000220 [Ogataea philodendri]|uniref:Uncharacterized protein n=1 Tax=Ogataea philodendri TaxID=1378263 RepID=A0A9P8PHS6_9ASCO|nr:uncharacterized protein OGAPHI_000220 [Ogataea philodendri]KAH3671517.1 hypothetical protein OGAPHI_000220 [Ogataea philodendri]
MTTLKDILDSVAQDDRLDQDVLLLGGTTRHHVEFLSEFGVNEISVNPYGVHYVDLGDVKLNFRSFPGPFEPDYFTSIGPRVAKSLVVHFLDAFEALRAAQTEEIIFQRVTRQLKPWIDEFPEAQRVAVVFDVAKVDYNVKSVPQIEFLQQLVRLIMMNYNGSTVYHQRGQTRSNFRSLLLDSPDIRIEDFDAIFVPYGTDSIGKIRIINDKFECEQNLEKWNRWQSPPSLSESETSHPVQKTANLRQKYQDFLKGIFTAV